jgi:hypothetical protein
MILPHHPLWGRLGLLVMQYGGRLRTLLKDAMLRTLPLPGADPLRRCHRPRQPAPARPDAAPQGWCRCEARRAEAIPVTLWLQAARPINRAR